MTDEKIKPGRALVGCAGWSVPRQSAAAFPEEGSHLERYAARFPAVEINSSFYRSHRAQTYARWAASVPEHFRFSVKLPRSITHDRRLADVDELLHHFANEVEALGDKLGCVLMQLPPSMQFDLELATRFIVALKQTFGCMIACEARNESWFSEEATELLRGAGITRVIADPAKGQPGPHVPTTSDIYVRLHGSPRVYYSTYEPDYLAQLARDLAVHNRAGRSAWCIFDNTMSRTYIDEALSVLFPPRD